MRGQKSPAELLVGLDVTDDAAVYLVARDFAIVETLDFFPPIVDDAYASGAIGAANAMSDVYAMGGEVLFALNIAAWPEDAPLAQLERVFAFLRPHEVHQLLADVLLGLIAENRVRGWIGEQEPAIEIERSQTIRGRRQQVRVALERAQALFGLDPRVRVALSLVAQRLQDARVAQRFAHGCSDRRSIAPARRAVRPARFDRAARRATRAPASAGR